MIGVLALQGDWTAHGEALDRGGWAWRPVRHGEQLAQVSGLVLPGGESSAMLRLLTPELSQCLEAAIAEGLPVLATCAGLILAAAQVQSPRQRSFGWVDVTVRRNGWGPQRHSFVDSDRVFVRAPRIVEVGPQVEVLDTVRGEPALVRQGQVVGATFHPELQERSSVFALCFGEPS